MTQIRSPRLNARFFKNAMLAALPVAIGCSFFLTEQTLALPLGKEGVVLRASYARFEYVEPFVMSEKGYLPGAGFAWASSVAKYLLFNLNASYFAGHIRYDGATWSGEPYQTTNFDWIANADFGLTLTSNYFAISGGLARRVWFDAIGGSYRRLTTYSYSPWTLHLFTGKDAAIKLSYFKFQRGVNESLLADVNSDDGNVILEQKRGWGGGIEWEHLVAFGKNFGYALGAEYWSIDNSEIAAYQNGYVVEPFNRTMFFYFDLNYRF